MPNKKINSDQGLDPKTLLPRRDPRYTTSPGTQRGGLIKQLSGEKSDQASPVRGAAFCGDSRELMEEFTGEVDLIVTSPPFALRRKKEYGNKDPENYIDWFLEFASLAHDILSDEGDLVIDIGGGWTKGEPIRSTYHFELLIELTSGTGDLFEEYGKQFNLAQDFYWYNPAKLPTPAQWVTIERNRVKDAVNHVWWLSKDNARGRENGKPDNASVLKPYSDAQNRLIDEGYEDKKRPSGHDISDKFDDPIKDGAIRPNFWNSLEESDHSDNLHDLLDHAGVSPALRRTVGEAGQLDQLAELVLKLGIPSQTTDSEGQTSSVSQVLEIANTRSRTRYLQGCDICNVDPHPARFPRELPEFFIKLLTEPGDLVVDIFGGSNITGWMAQIYDRNWISFEREMRYIDTSKFWFMSIDEIEKAKKQGWSSFNDSLHDAQLEVSADD